MKIFFLTVVTLLCLGLSAQAHCHDASKDGWPWHTGHGCHESYHHRHHHGTWHVVSRHSYKSEFAARNWDWQYFKHFKFDNKQTDYFKIWPDRVDQMQQELAINHVGGAPIHLGVFNNATKAPSGGEPRGPGRSRAGSGYRASSGDPGN